MIGGTPAEPEPVHKPSTQAMRGQEGPSSMPAANLLERELEISMVTGHVAAMQAGEGGRVLLVEGPPGIGKSTMLGAAVAAARRAELKILSARGSELESGFAFGVVRQLFEPWILQHSANDDPFAGTAKQALPALSPGTVDQDPAGDFGVLHGLHSLTFNACQHVPAAIVVDDLQWADTPSLRYLLYVAHRVADLDILMVLGYRPELPNDSGNLCEAIAASTGAQLIRLKELSEAGVTRYLQSVFEVHPGHSFASSCHRATGGNPMLVNELARACIDRGIAPTDDSAAQVASLGPLAVTRRVSLQMSKLSSQCTELAQAAAVLGPNADIGTAAELAAMTLEDALTAASQLEHVNILEFSAHHAGRIGFRHSLIHTVVYDSIKPAVRLVLHRKAADLLHKRGATMERIAAHILKTPPGQDPSPASLLDRAATEALARGAPDIASTYLDRALSETAGPERKPLLLKAARTAALVDMKASAEHLLEARALATTAPERAMTGAQLGDAYFYLGDSLQAIDAWRAALQELPDDSADTIRKINAGLINIALVEPNRQDLLDQLASLRGLDFLDGPGARTLDCILSLHGAFRLDRSSVDFARRGLAGGQLIGAHHSDSALVCGWLTLLAAEAPEALLSINAALAAAHQRGSTRALGAAYALRSLAMLWQGNLLAAESDAWEALHATDASKVAVARPFVATFLAESLAEQGKLQAADQALQWAGIPDPPPAAGPIYFHLQAQALLRRLSGQPREGLEAALAAGKYFEQFGGVSPAFIPWRSEAALCLHAMAQDDQAAQLVAEEVDLARRWGTSRPLGRALRVAGQVSGNNGLEYLEESLSVLDQSQDRLEKTKTQLALGMMLRRRNQRKNAQTLLSLAHRNAELCAAHKLARHAAQELQATGVGAVRPNGDGLAGLTAAERRVADLVAEGYSNREVAQTLFISEKTIELHLTNTYRKLGIRGRVRLAGLLRDE